MSNACNSSAGRMQKNETEICKYWMNTKLKGIDASVAAATEEFDLTFFLFCFDSINIITEKKNKHPWCV